MNPLTSVKIDYHIISKRIIKILITTRNGTQSKS